MSMGWWRQSLPTYKKSDGRLSSERPIGETASLPPDFKKRSFPTRKSLPLVALAAAILMLSVAASLASRATADACAARLPADAKLVYGAVIGAVAPGTDLVELVRSKARGLVMAGKLDRAQAQTAAQAAGACLKQAL